MSENENVTAQAEEAGADSFAEGWEDTGPAVEEETGGEQAEQQEEAPAEEAPAAVRGETEGGEAEETGGEQAAPERQPPRSWSLTDRQGRSVTVDEGNLAALAQKGLDYDRLQGEYDAAKPVMDLFRGFAEKQGQTVPEYLRFIRAQAKQAEGLSEEEARRAVELEDREAALSAQEARERARREAAEREQARRQAGEARVNADLREFLEAFPEAAKDPQSIPQEVWDGVRGGKSLVASYAMYSQRQARAAQEQAEAAAKRNADNAARSAGSMRSSGTNSRNDPFMDGWDEN